MRRQCIVFYELAKNCGFKSLFSSRYEFDEFYPGFRKVTLDNARRHGANNAQIQEINRRFDEGVMEAEDSWQGWDIELLALADEDYRTELVIIIGEGYRRCATQDLHED